MVDLKQEISRTTYPGRGIVIGLTADGKKAACAYFIMGRSENSRNRVFVEDGEGIRTQAFDPSKMEDPSLIIYAPVRVLGNSTIVTNGDQTDTVYDLMKEDYTLLEAYEIVQGEKRAAEDRIKEKQALSARQNEENKKKSLGNLTNTGDIEADASWRLS